MPRALPKPGEIRALAYVVACPSVYCGASIGMPCRSASSWIVGEPHAARRKAAEAQRHPFKPVDLGERAEARRLGDALMPPYDPTYPGSIGDAVRELGEAALAQARHVVEFTLNHVRACVSKVRLDDATDAWGVTTPEGARRADVLGDEIRKRLDAVDVAQVAQAALAASVRPWVPPPQAPDRVSSPVPHA